MRPGFRQTRPWWRRWHRPRAAQAPHATRHTDAVVPLAMLVGMLVGVLLALYVLGP